MAGSDTIDLDRELGALIRMHRVSRGMSQEDLAHDTQCRIDEIEAFETGTARLCITLFARICAALETAPSHMLAQMEERLAFCDMATDQATPSAVDFMASNRGRQIVRLLSTCEDERLLDALADLVVSACMTASHERPARSVPELVVSNSGAE